MYIIHNFLFPSQFTQFERVQLGHGCYIRDSCQLLYYIHVLLMLMLMTTLMIYELLISHGLIASHLSVSPV